MTWLRKLALLLPSRVTLSKLLSCFCASVSPSVARVKNNTSLTGLGGLHVLICAKCLEQSEDLCPQALFRVTGEPLQTREAEGEGEAANNCTQREAGPAQAFRAMGSSQP